MLSFAQQAAVPGYRTDRLSLQHDEQEPDLAAGFVAIRLSACVVLISVDDIGHESCQYSVSRCDFSIHIHCHGELFAYSYDIVRGVGWAVQLNYPSQPPAHILHMRLE